MSQHLNRRRFLLGTGAFIALPFLESLRSNAAWAQAAAPSRLVLMKFPNGVLKNTWMPQGQGTDFTLPAQLANLENFKSDLLIPTGLNNRPASSGLDGPGDHARSAGCFLTCVRINKSSQDIQAATSIDRVLAERLNMTASPRWLAVAAPGQGYGDSGYGAAYTSNISWMSPTTPASRVTDTREVFNILFPNAGPVPVSEAEKRRRYRKSILDGAIAEAQAMNSKLSASDKQKLDQYLTSVREVERSLASTDMQNPMACSPGSNPGSTGSDFALFTKTMMDLLVLGIACDRSRLITYFLDYEGSNRGGINGVSQGHHTVSHHPDNPGVYPGQYSQITRWYADRFAYFIEKLKSVPEGEGKSLLDATIVVFGSDIHDGNEHGHSNLPILIAGRGNGQLTTGRVLATNSAPLANLWVSLAGRMGVSLPSFGDSTGPLTGI